MIEKVTIENPITVDSRQSNSWAQEQTLRDLNAKMGSNNEILKRLGAKWNVDLDNLKEADSVVRDNNTAVGKNTDQVKESTKKSKEATESYTRSVDELRWSMRNYKNSMNDLISGSSDPLRRLPEVAENLGSGLAGLMGRSTALSRIFVGVGLAASLVIDRFLQAGDAYRSMIQAGVIFDGSVTGMAASVRSAGLSLEEGARLVSQYGQAMIVQGETRFFRSMEDLSRTFANLGLNSSQGSEAMLELMELQRMSGELFMISERDRIAANVQSLQLMQAEAILTGKSVQRQREEQRRIQESQRLQILQATLTPEQLAQQRLASTQLGRMGIPTEVIEGLLMESITGAATRVSGQARLSYGPVVEEVLQQIRRGQAGEIGNLPQRERLLTYQERLLQGGAAAALAYGQRSQDFVAQIAPVLQQGRMALRGEPDNQRERQARAEAMARGEQVLADQTVNLYNTQNQLAVATGRAEAALIRLAEHAINPLMSSISSLATSINSLAGSTSLGGAGNAIIGLAQNPLLQAGLAGGAGLLGLRAYRALRAGNASTLGQPPTVPGMASSAGAARPDMGSMRGGLAGVAGMGAGYLAGSMGAPTWASGALTGAGTGAMIGSIIPGIGTGIGAALGAALGGAYGYFGQEGTATAVAGGTQMPDMTASMNRLNTTMSQGLGPDGSVVRALMDLKSAIENSERAVVTAIRQQ
jgi:DNA-binding TFAR19-related protein (PDSD5 family)